MRTLIFFAQLFSKTTSYQAQKMRARSLLKQIREKGEVNEKLRNKLIRMLDGNIKEAEKLVARQRFGRDGAYSENYYYWLAIRKLEEKQNGDRGDLG
ncbi:MAG: hypothetical protein Fur0042_18280 [Cyanophyceae cyanobacterium]